MLSSQFLLPPPTTCSEDEFVLLDGTLDGRLGETVCTSSCARSNTSWLCAHSANAAKSAAPSATVRAFIAALKFLLCGLYENAQ